MPLVTTHAEIKKYLVTDASFDPDTLLPYLDPASEEIKEMLGAAQYQELLDYYESESTGIDELDALLPIVQRPLVYFAFLKGLDVFNVSIGNNGIAIISNSNLAPASKERVENLRINISNSAYDALETLLVFLEDNIDDYPLWEASDAYAYQYEYLISSARKFDEIYKINGSRLTFLEWRPVMADVEMLEINPQVSSEFMAELKSQIAAGTVTANNMKVLPHLQKALAYLTAAESQMPETGKSTTYSITMRQYSDVQRKQFRGKGLHYLMMVKQMLDAAPTDYPTYAASSVYDDTLTSYERYENDEDFKIAVFG